MKLVIRCTHDSTYTDWFVPHYNRIFTARRYARTVYTDVVSPSVCPFVRHKLSLYQNG